MFESYRTLLLRTSTGSFLSIHHPFYVPDFSNIHYRSYVAVNLDEPVDVILHPANS